jgi:YebC/PmpR family DNA-binding regulatory protein
MSGHNKWSKIKHTKGKTDAAKGRFFTKAVREIHNAVKQGGSGDPNMNFKLRLAIDKAKEVNMPAANIENAIKKATGGGDNVVYENIAYEGFAPHKVAMIIECMTDNRNRTIANVRNVVEKNGGSIASTGAVSWMFAHKGIFVFEPGQTTEEKLMEVALDAGADDIVSHTDGSFEVTSPVESFEAVNKALNAAGLKPVSSELGMVPKEKTMLKTVEEVKDVLAFLEKVDEDDDVQKVFTNYECDDAIMDQALK